MCSPLRRHKSTRVDDEPGWGHTGWLRAAWWVKLWRSAAYRWPSRPSLAALSTSSSPPVHSPSSAIDRHLWASYRQVSRDPSSVRFAGLTTGAYLDPGRETSSRPSSRANQVPWRRTSGAMTRAPSTPRGTSLVRAPVQIGKSAGAGTSRDRKTIATAAAQRGPAVSAAAPRLSTLAAVTPRRAR